METIKKIKFVAKINNPIPTKLKGLFTTLGST